MPALPFLGLGLSTNLGARDMPDPWRMLEAAPGLFDYVEYSAPLSIEEARRQAPRFALLEAGLDQLPAVFHPVHLNLWGPEIESPERLADLAVHLRSVRSPWVGNDVAFWHRDGQPFPGFLYLPPPFDGRGVEEAARHAAAAQEALPVPLLLENPVSTAVNGPLHVLDFMARLHERTGLGLILDVGHLLAEQLARGLPPTTGLDGFPLEHVIEVHVAGGSVTRRGGRAFYADDHAQPVREELFELLAEILPRCTSLRGLTFEGDGHPDAVARITLERLRPMVVRRRPAEPPLPRPVPPGDPGSRAREPAAWTPGIDPEGERAGADYRLAVLAAHLDVELPFARLYFAGDRHGLEAYAASPESASSAELGASFASWARRRLRESPDPGGEVVLAFETWLGSLRGGGRLATGVAVGVFPADLGELLFAAAALRRRAAGLALAGALPDPSPLEVLGQVARRAPARAWPVAVVRRASGREVIALDPELSRALQAAARGAPVEPTAGARARALGLVS